MLTRIYESKAIINHTSCDFKCKFDVRKINLNKKWNRKLYRYESKYLIKHHVCEKNLFRILVHEVSQIIQ